jgi:hypothetical protein
MLFFRSEEHVASWCVSHGYPIRPILDMDRLWALATNWYSNRLQGASRRPRPEEIREIFAGLGLTGEFWDPKSDSFG